MKRLWVILFILFSSLLFADEKTFVREYTYSTLKQDTKETARRVALYEVKMLLLEEVGVYIQSEFEMRDWEQQIGEKITSGEFAEQRLTSITAGITKTEILDEKWIKKWNRGEYYLRAKITLDPDEIKTNIEEIVNNKDKLRELAEVKKKANDAYAEIERLKIQLAEAKSDADQLRLTKAYNKETDILSATEWFNKGYNAGVNKEYDKAISFFLRVIELNPDNFNTYYNLGKSYGEQGNFPKAIEFYEKSIELDPDYAWAYNDLGFAYYNQGNITKAIQLYEKSLEIDPDNAFIYINLGKAYEDQDNLTKAIELYEKSIELDPDHAMTYNNLGLAYYNQGNITKAIQLYEKAIELDPDYAWAYINLGNTYSNFDKTLIYYKKAARLGDKGIQDWLKKNGHEW